MNVLLIGSGGREHALAIKICESKSLTKLICSPGNPGISKLAEIPLLNISNSSEVINFCNANKIDLVVIGSEKPLADGLANVLRQNKINVFGPDAEAAAIESEKSFAKNLMIKYKIPTASFAEFDNSQINEAKSHLKKLSYPLVIKADGLAAGKGVIICHNQRQAIEAVNEMLVNKSFGEAGNKIIIEEFMDGEEASIFAITDGKDFVCLPAAQDHKRIGDNDTGKNTGGMGAYAPAPLITDELQTSIEKLIIEPTINALMDEGKPFVGCLYAGLMITPDGPKVVEFNCRFGDPETQAVLPLLQGDFLELLYTAGCGRINTQSISYNGGSSVCVVLASGGYPDEYKSGFEISGLGALPENIIAYHAGTKLSEGKIVTAGGRVLGITSVISNNDLMSAKQLAYNAISQINFEGMYFRKDISDKAINR
ncbi:MAG: phosphoribosylamine--glycine ligase [Ignavibacteriales bacterium]|nr:MAG: phosphoribosylamine--glycine ligase [Ignavibacteriales bacterium]